MCTIARDIDFVTLPPELDENGFLSEFLSAGAGETALAKLSLCSNNISNSSLCLSFTSTVQKLTVLAKGLWECQLGKQTQTLAVYQPPTLLLKNLNFNLHFDLKIDMWTNEIRF